MLSLFLALAGAQPPVTLEPASPWAASPRDIGCVASRRFGEHGEIAIGWEAQVGTAAPYLIVETPRNLLPSGIGSTKVKLDTGATLAVHYGAFDVADSRRRLLRLFPTATDTTQLAAAKTLEIGDDGPVLKDIGLYDEGRATLNACMAKLISSWGADPQPYLDGRLARMTGRPQAWINDDNYPAEARAHHVGGDVTLLVTTGVDGTVSSCKVLSSTHPLLDRGSCAAITKVATFRPPLDANGQPMASYAAMTIHWTAP